MSTPINDLFADTTTEFPCIEAPLDRAPNTREMVSLEAMPEAMSDEDEWDWAGDLDD